MTNGEVFKNTNYPPSSLPKAFLAASVTLKGNFGLFWDNIWHISSKSQVYDKFLAT